MLQVINFLSFLFSENVHLRSLLQLQINKTLKLNFHAENLENNFEELQDTAAYLESGGKICGSSVGGFLHD